MPAAPRIPVTVLTGFLGAGKTTLLNRILTEHHGQRIAVIENEFGEVGIDHHLVIGADEEIFEMNNGCICCTVRGDLIRILGNLLKRRDRFDRILVETTGMADPGPVAQTFLVDPDVAANTVLDGIVTVVDAAHIAQHLDDGSDESRSQIAFADSILINKCDVVPERELVAVERRVRGINAAARLHRAIRCDVDLAQVLDLGGFDLDRVLRDRPDFLQAERGYEWLAVLRHDGQDTSLHIQPGPDPEIAVALVPITGPGEAEAAATKAFLSRAMPTTDMTLRPGPVPISVPAARPVGLRIAAPAGMYALATQHDPAEFQIDVGALALDEARHFAASHEHDERVASVGIEREGAVDGERFNAWLSTLLRERGQDLYRTKGILSVDGMDRRYVFHGVHMLMEGRLDQPWANGPRINRLVFIGRDLDRAALTAGFAACLV
jgi:G3E family GTPase